MARLTSVAFAALTAILGAPALASLPPSAAETFPIGTSGSVCEAQGVAMGEARQSVFDRKWVILCRDVARPVGNAYSLRGDDDFANKTLGRMVEALTCAAPAPEAVASASGVMLARCRDKATNLDWNVYTRRKGATLHVVEGLAGYDSALRLALANLAADRVVPGEVAVATTGGPGSLAQARASVGDLDTLIGQGYRGNNAGAYAEAAELFAAASPLLALNDTPNNLARTHELKVNRALQLSNLGQFDQASRLFAEARVAARTDPVQSRLGRNFEAIDAINRGDLAAVGTILARPVPSLPAPQVGPDGAIQIDRSIAAAFNGVGAATGVLGQETRLTPGERAMIIDAQALQLGATALRLQGRHAEARERLARAYADAMRVRDGRVVSITRLRSQILSESALTYEAEGRNGEAEGLLRQAQRLVETQYPDSASVSAAQARLAGFLTRHGKAGEARTIYRGIVQAVSGNRGALVGMANLMRPYFDMLAADGQNPDTVKELFLAGQLVERPGAADTLAQLSRQLEGGSDEAAGLFRQSLTLSREIERTRMRLAQASALAEAGTPPAGVADLQQRQKRLLDNQAELMNRLGAYPQYRAVGRRAATLDELRATLKPNEAYLKLAELSGLLYAVYVSPTTARGWRVSKGSREVSRLVGKLRDSISVTIKNVRATYPFDVDAALALHDALLGPVAGELPAVRHLVFEPDGALLQLPVNLLTGDRAAVQTYHGRVKAGGDDYDFTGIAWLGRTTAVSTAVSAASFRDARSAPASKAAQAYLGLGQNQPVGQATPAVFRSAATGPIEPGCEWPAAAWNQPISAAELRTAASLFGPAESDLITDAAFTDTAIKSRSDLDSYRILHFATHGLVAAPREGCPARPALLTSFGPEQSDGLLGFTEIFDLNLDADLVILSACDTAAQASREATLEAGVTTGGGQALDGLVRAFIAAGGRQVIASHWPAPDDYDATRRLFTGFFGNAGAPIGDALLRSQLALMDEARTSHPFYWAGFAVIGDAGRTLAPR